MDILEKIVAARKERIKKGGAAQGLLLPDKREVPVVPFGCSNSGGRGRRCFVIGEVKGKSPSAGIIKNSLDPVSAAAGYAAAGLKEISVLTEEEFFGGSLRFLYEVKKKLPFCSLLRKDFLLSEEDIEVSYLAGADAVLLIASILEKDLLGNLIRKALSLGITPLVEVHNASDIAKAGEHRPELVGINSRDLRSFRTDKALPLMLAGLIAWDAALVYESGVKSESDALFAFDSGFSAVLCGEALMRDETLAGRLSAVSEGKSRQYLFSGGKFCGESLPPGYGGSAESREGGDIGAGNALRQAERFFWRRLYSKKSFTPGKPLVKICGITNREDGAMAADLGADIIGMVFAVSPRKALPSLPEKLSGLDTLKAAVVRNPDEKLLEMLALFYRDGLIDAIQFHGSETQELCESPGVPWYKAFCFPSAAAANATGVAIPDFSSLYSCPRFLFDSSAGGKEGGCCVPLAGYLVE